MDAVARREAAPGSLGIRPIYGHSEVSNLDLSTRGVVLNAAWFVLMRNPPQLMSAYRDAIFVVVQVELMLLAHAAVNRPSLGSSGVIPVNKHHADTQQDVDDVQACFSNSPLPVVWLVYGCHAIAGLPRCSHQSVKD